MKYCVIRVNLTRGSYEIACTGLYQSEAKFIAESRNYSLMRYKEPEYKLHHHWHHDKIVYVPCRNSHVVIEYTLASLFPEYYQI